MRIVGSGAAAVTTIAIPAHAAGDLILVFAYRSGSNTAPTLPAGWTDLGSSGANSNSIRIGGRIAVDDATISGTWTSATRLAVAVLRGHDTTRGAVLPGVGAVVFNLAYASIIDVPAIACEDARSHVFGFVGLRSDTFSNVHQPPAGMTAVAWESLANLSWTDTGVAEWPATPSISQNYATGSMSASLEVLVPAVISTAPAAPTISAGTAYQNQTILRLEKGAEALSHEVHRSLSPGFTPSAGTLVKTVSAARQAVWDNPVAPGTTYYYKALALNDAGSAESNELAITTPATGSVYGSDFTGFFEDEAVSTGALTHILDSGVPDSMQRVRPLVFEAGLVWSSSRTGTGSTGGDQSTLWSGLGVLTRPHIRTRLRANNNLARPGPRFGDYYLTPINGAISLRYGSQVGTALTSSSQFAANIWFVYEMAVEATRIRVRAYQEGAAVPAWQDYTPADLSTLEPALVGVVQGYSAHAYYYSSFEIVTADVVLPSSGPDTPTLTVADLTPTSARLVGSPYSHPQGKPHVATEWDLGGTVVATGPVTEYLEVGRNPATQYTGRRVRYRAGE
jgi:hypothetical protein